MLIQDWLQNVPKDFPKLLIYDHAPIHGLSSIKEKWRKMLVRRVLVPPGLTSYFQYIDVYFGSQFKANYSKQFSDWLVTDPPMPNAAQRRILHTKWVAAAVKKTLETADVAKAFAQLGYTWMGTKPICRGLDNYDYSSPVEEHPTQGFLRFASFDITTPSPNVKSLLASCCLRLLANRPWLQRGLPSRPLSPPSFARTEYLSVLALTNQLFYFQSLASHWIRTSNLIPSCPAGPLQLISVIS